MSKIAVNEAYGGNTLCKAIDYFCHLAVNPDFYKQLIEVDKELTSSEYFPKLAWLNNV